MKVFFDMYLLAVILVIFKYYTNHILYIYITHIILIIYYKYDQHQHQTKNSHSNNNIPPPISIHTLFIIIIHNPKILPNSNNPSNKFRLIKNNRIR
jgi:hypothetical protein